MLTIYNKISDRAFEPKSLCAIMHSNEMILEEREVVRTKTYISKLTNRPHTKRVRRPPTNLWKQEIIEEIVRMRRDGAEINGQAPPPEVSSDEDEFSDEDSDNGDLDE
jgi:hypothetical protein